MYLLIPLEIIQALAVILHAVGIVALIETKPQTVCCIMEIHRLFLLNLSMVDLTQALLAIITDICEISGNDRAKTYLEYINHGFYIAYVFIMASIAINRFAEIYFSLKYPLYWSSKRTKILLVILWGLGITDSIGTVIYYLLHENIVPKQASYFDIFLDANIFLISIFSNGYLIYKIFDMKKTSRQCEQRLSKKNHSKTPLSRIRSTNDKTPYFLISSLVFTMVIFIVLPNLTVHLMTFGYLKHSKTVIHLSLLFYGLGLLSDAVIYILFYRKVKQYLWKKISSFLYCNEHHNPDTKSFLTYNQTGDIVELQENQSVENIISN